MIALTQCCATRTAWSNSDRCDAASYMYAAEGAAVNTYAINLARKLYTTWPTLQLTRVPDVWLIMGDMALDKLSWLDEEDRKEKQIKASVWREATFLGKTENFQPSVATGEESSAAAWVDVIHASVLRKKSASNEKSVGVKEGSSVLCPCMSSTRLYQDRCHRHRKHLQVIVRGIKPPRNRSRWPPQLAFIFLPRISVKLSNVQYVTKVSPTLI